MPEQQQMRPPRPAQTQLSAEDLSEILREASRRHGAEQEQKLADGTTMEDALLLARELGIPEEHVRSAADEILRRKAGGQKTSVTRRSRSKALLWTLALTIPAAFAALKIGGAVAFLLLAACGLALLVTGIAWLSTFLGDGNRSADLPPVPGRCRICWKPAHSPESTFCEEHRYKTPTA